MKDLDKKVFSTKQVQDDSSKTPSRFSPQSLPSNIPLSTAVPPLILPHPFKHLIFAYGTLKKNMRNHYRMAKPGIAFAFKAISCDKFPLILDPFNRHRPCLLNIKGLGHRVHGEVYAVDDEELQNIDEFERVPAHYQRHLFPVEVVFDSSTDKDFVRAFLQTQEFGRLQRLSSSPTIPTFGGTPADRTRAFSLEDVDAHTSTPLRTISSVLTEQSLVPMNNELENGLIILCHIYCQKANSIKFQCLQSQTSSSLSPPCRSSTFLARKNISPVTSLEESLGKNAETTNEAKTLPTSALLYCYGKNEDKMYIPRDLGKVDSTFHNIKSNQEVQQLSRFYKDRSVKWRR
ncbi:AIG2 family protein [Cardiosporidium cionae]|uniref:Gamma-glutamylcyclotransferase family protein n=1 Tax=Cardiosporidium cionae TaxID=476202 RepID=A0ABQ7JEL9_9APIC|nr:AIG2 family protein [Cardiosporidium cionae]|eukprot:KAF8822444.1 AIG2 family protein [Cardiosporidium cionae]